MNTIHRPDLGDALRRREAYLRDGIPPVLASNVVDEARKRRARVFRVVAIRLNRAMSRLGRGAARGRCDCGDVAPSLRT